MHGRMNAYLSPLSVHTSVASRRKNNMTPKYVVYECENCGKLFYRGVAEVLADEAEHCAVNVEMLTDNEGNVEEFPMCGCLGGDEGHTLNTERAEEATPSESAE